MTIQEAIRKMAAAGTEPYCKVCTVDAVDEDARTVDCTPLDEGAPLVGVNILIQGTATGVVSGSDGGFSIRMPEGRDNLIFSYIGYNLSRRWTCGNARQTALICSKDKKRSARNRRSKTSW